MDRQKLIEEKIRAEEERHRQGNDLVRERVLDLLKNDLGYTDDEILIDKCFDIPTLEGSTPCSVDYIIRVDDKNIIAIKCSLSSIESRERNVIAFSRVVEEYQIPYSVVTDGIEARVIKTVTGKTLSEDINDIPSKDKLDAEKIDFVAVPEERKEKERRILLAFETLNCSALPQK